MLASLCRADPLEPLNTQNLSPFTALLGVPRWELAAAMGPGLRLRVNMDLANHLAASSTGAETVILDGETLRGTLAVRRALGAAWTVGLDLPYVRHSGGFLDSAIDAWHNLFGLPNGGRELRAEDLLQFELRRAGVAVNRLTQPQTGIGDVTLTAARLFGSAGLELHGRVKLSTGDAQRFTGSGGTDVSVMLIQQRPRLGPQRWHGYYWGAGVVVLDQVDLSALVAEDYLLVGLAGSAFQLTPRVNLKAQLELHSAPFKAEVEELGDPSVQLSFGASIQLAPDVSLDLAISEDLLVNSAPDVVFHLGLRWDR